MADSKCSKGDTLRLLPVTGQNGGQLAVRHTADHRSEVGEVHLVKEGQPIIGRALVTKPLEGGELAVVGEVNTTAPTRPGPARVTTEAYRDGWDRIFGKPAAVGSA